MQKITGLTITSLLLLTGCAGAYSNNDEMAAKNVSHTHMGHVSTAWNDTPDNKGLLITAMAEAEIAAFHAGLAANKPDDLEWMKVHVRHVKNALDPSTEAKGPGMGYGVVKASAGTAKHIGFAADSADASQNVKAHSTHVATSAQNTVNRANEILALSDKVLAAGSAGTAASLVKQISGLADQLANGFDANGDGNITWLTKRLGKSVSVPDLSAQGFTLLGGRLLPGEDKPVALFMYENQNGQRVTLNITRSKEAASPTAFLFSSSGTIRTFFWIDNDFGYAISGEINKPPLLTLAKTVYHQLNL